MMGVMESGMKYSFKTYSQGAIIKFDIRDETEPNITIAFIMIIFCSSFFPTSIKRNAFKMLRLTRHPRFKKYIKRFCLTLTLVG